MMVLQGSLKANQWGIFPSVALAWKIKDESFLKDVEALSDLKLRLGWGETGQQDIVGNDYPGTGKIHDLLTRQLLSDWG
jgi:hypothetical protein